MYQKVLITGQMRSGTTLLCNFLNSQKNITMYADIFHTVAGRVPDPRGWSFSNINYLADIPQTNKYYLLFSMSHGIDVLKTANEVKYQLDIDPKKFNTMKELYYLLLDSIAKKDDLVVGNKVTSCEINIENISKQTDIKVLYIHRDARDVILSAAKKFKRPIDEYIQAWNHAINIVIKINNPNFLCIKFEDLISKDDKVKKKIENFLGVPINFEIERLQAYNNKWVANSSFEDVNSLFDKTVAYRWKNNITWDIEKIYSLCNDQLAALGYDPM
ncbi:MAG: sulfotransferase [Desulfobacteraceae bacterium]|nr:sulfotransferase [Desulfobacteraceae bacterium]